MHECASRAHSEHRVPHCQCQPLNRFHEYTQSSSKNYDADTTTLFDNDPDLIRLRRHVAFAGSPSDVGSPIGAYLTKRGFSSSAEFDPNAEDVNEVEEEINIPMLHSKG